MTALTPVLDRLPNDDTRSVERYHLRGLPTEVVEQRKIRSIGWQCKPRLDQGREGACVGFGLAHELAASPKPVPQTNDDALRWYHNAQAIDGYPDSTPGTSVRAGAEAVRQAGLIVEYRWGTSLADLQQALMYGPVILGLNWYGGMFRPDAAGVIRVSGKIEGGHCLAAIGQSFKTELVRLRQSWGADHGVNGDVYIPFADLARLIAEDGDVCIPLTRRMAA